MHGQRHGGRAGTGGAGARSSRPARWRSSGRSGRCRAAPARSGRRRSREPSSIVPVVSTVTARSAARSAPAAASPARAPMSAALACSRSWAGLDEDRVDAAVEHARDLRPGRRRAAWRTARGRGWAAWCPGPTEPSTQRGRSGVDQSSADLAGDPRRRPGPARRSGRRCRTRRGWPSWRRTCWSRPRRRRPRSRRRGSPRTMSGRVTLRISLQPSRPSKSSSVEVVRPAAWCPSPRRRRRRARPERARQDGSGGVIRPCGKATADDRREAPTPSWRCRRSSGGWIDRTGRVAAGDRRSTDWPELTDPVAVAAFEGWNDAGDAATRRGRAPRARLGRRAARPSSTPTTTTTSR